LSQLAPPATIAPQFLPLSLLPPQDADVPAAETRDRDGWGYPVRRDQTHGALGRGELI